MRQTAWLAMLAAAGLAVVAGGTTTLRAAINDGLVVHLRLDGDLQDSSGRGNHGAPGVNALFFNPASTNSDGLSRQPLIGSGSLDFSFGDATEYVVLSSAYADLQFGAATDFTVSMWVQKVPNPAAPRGDGAIFIGNRDNSAYVYNGWALQGRDRPVSQWTGIYNGSTGSRDDFLSNGDIAAGATWHHLAVSFDRSGSANYFEDGSLIASKPIAGSGSVDTGLSTVIGQNPAGNNGRLLTHNFDDVGIWRRALSAAEIHTIATQGLAGVSLQDIPLGSQLRPGDINGDGATNDADYNIWNANVGFTNGTGRGDAASLAKGDADFNGVVNLGDFDVISASANPPLGVPEPGSLALAAGGLAAFALLRRRGARR